MSTILSFDDILSVSRFSLLRGLTSDIDTIPVFRAVWPVSAIFVVFLSDGGVP